MNAITLSYFILFSACSTPNPIPNVFKFYSGDVLPKNKTAQIVTKKDQESSSRFGRLFKIDKEMIPAECHNYRVKKLADCNIFLLPGKHKVIAVWKDIYDIYEKKVGGIDYFESSAGKCSMDLYAETDKTYIFSTTTLKKSNVKNAVCSSIHGCKTYDFYATATLTEKGEAGKTGDVVGSCAISSGGGRAKFDLTMEYLNKAIEINPKDATAYYKRGFIYRSKGQYDLSISDISKAIEIEPKNHRNYTMRGITYSKNKQYALAVSDISKAIEIEPKNPRNYIMRGIIHRKNKQYDLSINDINKSIAIEPKNPRNYIMRGITYRKNKQYDLALSDFNKGIDIKPKYFSAYRQIGITYGKKKQYELAISAFNKLIEIKGRPRSATVRVARIYRGGMYLDHLGNKINGCADLKFGCSKNITACANGKKRSCSFLKRFPQCSSYEQARQKGNCQ